MAAVDLRFSQARDTTPPYDLVFGADEGGSTTANLAVAATLPAPTLACTLDHDNAVFRGVQNGPRSDWQDGGAFSAAARNVTQDADRLPSGKESRWSAADRLAATTRNVTQDAVATHNAPRSGWGEGVSLDASRSESFNDMTRTRSQAATGWREGIDLRGDVANGWQDRFRFPRPSRRTTWQEAKRLRRTNTSRAGSGRPVQTERATWWDEAMRPPPGYWNGWPVVPPVEPPCYEPPPGGNVPLLFRYVRDGTADLLFICRSGMPEATVIIPAKRVYIVLNEVRLSRVDGNIELPVLSLSLTIDAGSWTYGFTASLPKEALPNVEPAGYGDPVVLDAVINGAHYRLLAENIGRDRQFGSTRISVSGRGISAMLAEPYSPTLSFYNTEARTAQQLVADALTTNGASLGWSVDWQLTDWLVPAGAWSQQGSYMKAVTAIAEAAGGYVQPHPIAQTLRILPRYPVKPWEWASATPDIELPAAVVERESLKWEEFPAYNAVFVTGEANGVIAHVKRTGTAGDVVAPMVADPLITHADAGRQRGISILGKTGRLATVSLSLPVLPDTGIIHPGKLIRYVDGGTTRMGLTRGVSVSTSLPTVRQTIELEVHP